MEWEPRLDGCLGETVWRTGYDRTIMVEYMCMCVDSNECWECVLEVGMGGRMICSV